jgi:hypothetical protein
MTACRRRHSGHECTVLVALQRVLSDPALEPAEAQALQAALSVLTSVAPSR